MTKKFHSCPMCKGTENEKADFTATERNVKINHKLTGLQMFEAFTDSDHDFVHDYVHKSLCDYMGKRPTAEEKKEIEKIVLAKMGDISKDEYAIHWNEWSPERVSFTIHYKHTTYEPRFAPGCTVTVL